MPSPHAQLLLTTIRRVLALCLMASPLLSIDACKKSDPSSPGEEPKNCYALTAKPTETKWAFAVFHEGPAQQINGNYGTWNRGEGLGTGAVWLVSGDNIVFLEITESAFQPTDCKIDIVKMYWQQNGLDSIPKEYLTPFHGPNPVLHVDYLSDDAISGYIDMFVTTDTSNTRTQIAFDVLNNPCSPTAGSPDSAFYTIVNITQGTFPVADTLCGITTRWGRSIGLVVLGEEPGANSTPSWGMNMFVREPLFAIGSNCKLTLARAELTVASRRDSFPEVTNYVFPGEEGEVTSLNDILDVDFLTDLFISAEGTIPMQRRTYSPTQGFQWHEKVDVRVKFDAKEF